MVIDTHAGAGLYRLDDKFAQTSGEAAQGFLKLLAADRSKLVPALADYVDLVTSFAAVGARDLSQGRSNDWLQTEAAVIYPGSPLLIQRRLRDHDKLRVFELHPTDSRTLAVNLDELDAGRQVAMFTEDGFEGTKKFLPPPSRRALVLTDPSYEMKSDYQKVLAMLADSIKRFATGTYLIWYPIIPRAEALDLPRKLKALAVKSGKGWLNASLSVKSATRPSTAVPLDEGPARRAGLTASGVFVLNPPYTLQLMLESALPQMVKILGQDRYAGFTLALGEGK